MRVGLVSYVGPLTPLNCAAADNKLIASDESGLFVHLRIVICSQLRAGRCRRIERLVVVHPGDVPVL